MRITLYWYSRERNGPRWLVVAAPKPCEYVMFHDPHHRITTGPGCYIEPVVFTMLQSSQEPV